MKKIFSLLLIAFALNSSAQSILHLINNTGKQVSSAVAYYDSESQYWVCKGWYTVKAYDTTDIDLGDYTGKVYVHGTQSAYLGLSSVTWGNGYSLCVDPKDAFIIRDASQVNCDNKRSFSEKQISTGINRWEFNPK